jgi:hypothetical protein
MRVVGSEGVVMDPPGTTMLSMLPRAGDETSVSHEACEERFPERCLGVDSKGYAAMGSPWRRVKPVRMSNQASERKRARCAGIITQEAHHPSLMSACI